MPLQNLGEHRHDRVRKKRASWWKATHEIHVDMLPALRGGRQRLERGRQVRVGWLGALTRVAALHEELDIPREVGPEERAGCKLEDTVPAWVATQGGVVHSL